MNHRSHGAPAADHAAHHGPPAADPASPVTTTLKIRMTPALNRHPLIGAIVAELTAAKDHPGAEWRVMLAAGTVVLSWLFVQIVFAMHYAHVYYMEEDNGRPKGGLEFGECGEPDYWDFVHFSIVLGATSQTADITFSSKETRRIGTLHTLVAFGFNTAILATMINLAAGLF